MSIADIFDRLFVDQLFATNARGETIYYPHGATATGYLVPPAREPRLRAGLRWLVLGAIIGVNAFAWLVPPLLDALDLDVPLGWFIGGAAVALILSVGAVIHLLKRLAAGLAPAST